MTVGILGGGQLGRMLALAGIPLGLRFRFLDPDADAPCAQVAEQILAAYDDPAALDRLTAGAEVVTFEFENVPAQVAQHLESHAKGRAVHPPALALATLQDRLLEKSLFVDCGVSVPEFVPVATREELSAAVKTLGVGAGLVIKGRRMGYDGKGQAVIRPQAAAGGLSVAQQVEAAWADLSARAAAGGLIIERFVAFKRELSLIGVRARDGATRFYPLVQNHHARGVLRTTIAPAPDLAPGLQQAAEDRARAIMQKLEYVGVLAIEFFESTDRKDGIPVLLGNEMAPRVHNTGHWTIEGAPTSQFENHIRAIVGLPLGETTPRQPCAMVNILGRFPRSAEVLGIPGAHLHLYGKSERPGRKIGHITILADSHEQLPGLIERVERLLPNGD